MSWIKKYKESVFCHTSKRQLYGLYCDLHLWGRLTHSYRQCVNRLCRDGWGMYLWIWEVGTVSIEHDHYMHSTSQTFDIFSRFVLYFIFFTIYYIVEHTGQYGIIWQQKEVIYTGFLASCFIHRNTVDDIFIDKPCSKKLLPW